MSAGAPELTPVDIRLSFRLGELGLFHKRLSGFADRTHFSCRLPCNGVPSIDEALDASLVYYPTYPIAVAPPAIVLRDGWIAYTPYVFKNYYIDVSRFDDFDDYLRTALSSKSRATLLRKVRKFAQTDGGATQWRRFDRGEDMARFFEDAGKVSARSYQERLLDSGLPRTAEFIAQAESSADAGRTVGFVLYLHDKPAAYMYCALHNGVATYEHVGYDPELRSLSPGTVLHYHALKSIFDSGTVRIFDFTEGEGTHKAFFASDHQLCAKTYFLKRNLLNQVLVRSHHGLSRGVELAGRVLDRMGIKSAVKRLIRRLA